MPNQLELDTSNQPFTCDREGQCPNCGGEDEELCYLKGCGKFVCEDCHSRHEEKYPAEPAPGPG